MTKTKTKSKTKSKTQVRNRAAVSVGPVSSRQAPQVTLNDFDPHEGMNVAGASPKDVIQKSETAAPLEAMTERTMNLAEQVAERWEKRRQKEGKRVWVSPFSSREDRNQFDTEGECKKFMNTNQKNLIKQAKLTGKPPADYSPRMLIISPKRTMDDLVTPKQAELMKRMREANAGLEDIRNQSLGLAAANDMKAGKLMSMSEQMASQKVDLLNDTELKGAAHLAWSHGKTVLLKAIRAICKRRGITLQF